MSANSPERLRLEEARVQLHEDLRRINENLSDKAAAVGHAVEKATSAVSLREHFRKNFWMTSATMVGVGFLVATRFGRHHKSNAITRGDLERFSNQLVPVVRPQPRRQGAFGLFGSLASRLLLNPAFVTAAANLIIGKQMQQVSEHAVENAHRDGLYVN